MSNTTRDYAQSCQENCQWLADYLKTQLTEHPASVGQTWGRHCIDTLWCSGQALTASGALLIHALFPCWCQGTGDHRVESLAASTRPCKRAWQCLGDAPLSHSIHEKDH